MDHDVDMYRLGRRPERHWLATITISRVCPLLSRPLLLRSRLAFLLLPRGNPNILLSVATRQAHVGVQPLELIADLSLDPSEMDLSRDPVLPFFPPPSTRSPSCFPLRLASSLSLSFFSLRLLSARVTSHRASRKQSRPILICAGTVSFFFWSRERENFASKESSFFVVEFFKSGISSRVERGSNISRRNVLIQASRDFSKLKKK